MDHPPDGLGDTVVWCSRRKAASKPAASSSVGKKQPTTAVSVEVTATMARWMDENPSGTSPTLASRKGPPVPGGMTLGNHIHPPLPGRPRLSCNHRTASVLP